MQAWQLPLWALYGLMRFLASTPAVQDSQHIELAVAMAIRAMSALAAEDVERTREVVSGPSWFLRRAVSLAPADPVPLSEEIDLVRDSLAIEEARFEQRFSVDIVIANGADATLVPPLILQPLIENVVK